SAAHLAKRSASLERPQMWRRVALVSIDAQMIRPERVDHDHDEVLATGALVYFVGRAFRILSPVDQLSAEPVEHVPLDATRHGLRIERHGQRSAAIRRGRNDKTEPPRAHNDSAKQ